MILMLIFFTCVCGSSNELNVTEAKMTCGGPHYADNDDTRWTITLIMATITCHSQYGCACR